MSTRHLVAHCVTAFFLSVTLGCGSSASENGEELVVFSAKIKIGVEQLSDYRVFDAVYNDGNTFLVGYNPQSSSLDIFDITHRKLLHVKPISRTGPEAVSEVLSFSMRNDSIVWFACMNRFIAYNVNQQKVIESYALEDLNDRFSLARYSYFFDNRGKLVALNDSMAILSAAYFPLYDGNSKLTLAALNVNTGKVQELVPGIPEWVSGDHHFGGLNTMHYHEDDGQIIYNFPFMDSVFTWPVAGQSIKREQYVSKVSPGVIESYRGDGSMESIIHASSESDYYTGVQPVMGTQHQYRFAVSTSIDEEIVYTTYLEVFEKSERRYTYKIPPTVKTRGFTSKDSIFLFTESGNEDYLEFSIFSGL